MRKLLLLVVLALVALPVVAAEQAPAPLLNDDAAVTPQVDPNAVPLCPAALAPAAQDAAPLLFETPAAEAEACYPAECSCCYPCCRNKCWVC